MDVQIDDLTGLNAERLRDMPLLKDQAEAMALCGDGRAGPIAAAGMRHSQGGHTVVRGGRMAWTLASLNRIGAIQPVHGQRWTATVKVEAGTTWGELHHALAPHRYSPMVQQSSADFSIGGSIAVNCHGRDPRWGPLVDSVEDVTVLTGLRDEAGAPRILTASRTVHADLFAATVGGYGGSGFILEATLRVVPDRLLVYVGDPKGARRPEEYVEHAKHLLGTSPQDIHLHYAWLSCHPGFLYRRALVADFRDGGEAPQVPAFDEEEWGPGELLRAGWSLARKQKLFRIEVWRQLVERHAGKVPPGEVGMGCIKTRTNWLRAPTSFTAYRGQRDAQILQEYFVPVDATLEMLKFLSNLFLAATSRVDVLSTTLRVVRRDALTLLSYCPDGDRICIAVEMMVPTRDTDSGRMVDLAASGILSRAIQKALDLGGSFYLPYYRIAGKDPFDRAYPNAGKIRQAMDKYNPVQADGKRRFWNNFLQAYFPA